MQLETDQVEIIERAMNNARESFSRAVESYGHLLKIRGTAVAPILMHEMLDREPWTRGKLIVLLVAAMQDRAEMEAKANGVAPF